MRRSQFTCSRSFVQQEAEQWVQGCLHLMDYGRKVSGVLLARVLIMAASLECRFGAWAARPSDGGRSCPALGANRPFWPANPLFRKRFGIETSYRQLGEGLAQTTSRDRRYRLLRVGLALLLRNVWV